MVKCPSIIPAFVISYTIVFKLFIRLLLLYINCYLCMHFKLLHYVIHCHINYIIYTELCMYFDCFTNTFNQTVMFVAFEVVIFGF